MAKIIAKKFDCTLKVGKQDSDQRSYKVSFKKQYKIFKNINFKRSLSYSFNEIIKNYNKKHNFDKNEYYNLKTLQKLKEKKLIKYLL